VSDIECWYGARRVLHHVAFDARKGEMLGIIGPNGSGKTTLLRVVSGVLKPSRGRVMIDGHDVSALDRRTLARRVAVVSQDVVVDFSFDVREVVLMGRNPHLGRLGWESRHDQEVAQRAMELADVAHLADRPITEISGGERQRVFIALALAQEPSLLLLDEPTSHLDIDHQVGILDLIRDLNRRQGVTVLLVSHDLNLASEYCERLILLDQGRIHLAGKPADVLTEGTIRDVYRAKVRLERNPVTGRPHIILIPGQPGK